jgi:hypothetical protein
LAPSACSTCRPGEFSLGERAELANMADEVVSVLIQRDIAKGSRLF